ncbi:immunity 49 family protein [Streptomyces sp. NPDC051644]|uniref:immunity 49 family protein n=1 Tax=Streptomyces sp. NPDC051644 TaxID=3365666 RepID=UPI0037894AED
MLEHFEISQRREPVVASIPRHEYPTDGAAEDGELLHTAALQAIDDLEGDSKVIDQALLLALTEAECRSVLDPVAGNAPTWRAWVASMQIGSAMFAVATATDGGVAARIAGEVRSLTPSGPLRSANAGNWIKAFWLSVICREQDRMTELCNVPISVLRGSGAEYDEYIYAWIDALQSYWLNRGNVGEKMVAAVDGTAPESVEIASRELMLKILCPPLDLFHRYLRQDHEQFNAALVDAVQWHKEYWTADADRASSSEGLVALGPLAMACLAYDAGYPIEIESDYLPKALLESAWVGEIDT